MAPNRKEGLDTFPNAFDAFVTAFSCYYRIGGVTMRLGIMTSIMLWLCMFSLCSCVSSGPIESDYNSESETMQTPNSMFFDWELTNKPTDSQMKKVRKGMSYYEVVEIIGKPHSFADNIDNSQTFKWITQEGNVFFCFFLNYSRNSSRSV